MIVSFTRWWEEIVIKDLGGKTFNRRDVVLALANTEGGAHVDPLLNEDYAQLSNIRPCNKEGAPQQKGIVGPCKC